MTHACPILTPAQQRCGEIQERIKADLIRQVDVVLTEAAERARTEMEAAGLDMAPPSRAFFAASAHQHLFCVLCGADPETFANGKADVATAIIRNSQNIAKHHWGADPAPHPRS